MNLKRSDLSAQRVLDGSLQRSEASRKRIVRAVRELIRAGDLSASALAAAARVDI